MHTDPETGRFTDNVVGEPTIRPHVERYSDD